MEEKLHEQSLTDPSDEISSSLRRDDTPDNRSRAAKIEDKNWKVRLNIYEEMLKDLHPQNVNDIIADIGSSIILMSSDINNNAYDIALEVLIIVFDLCDISMVSQYIEKISQNVSDKAFTSRTSTQTKGKALLHKMMEVTDPLIVTTVLLSKLLDKKPKVPPLCLETIYEGISLFGISVFPIKEILKSLGPMFNSNNGSCRDNALNLVALIHHWIGLIPLTALLETLRPAQKVEFDKLIESQTSLPRPSPTLSLRKNRGTVQASALKVSSCLDPSEFIDEVDLAKKLKSTECTKLLQSDKWIDQVQGIQIIIDAVGSIPKLKSSPINHDLTVSCHELLKTGHLQVQTKCLKILTLFSQGLKGKFSTDARNIISTVLAKSKEKKLVDAVQECAQSFFETCISIDNWADDISEILKNKKCPTHSKILCQELIMSISRKMQSSMNYETLKLFFEASIICCDDSDPKVRDNGVKILRIFSDAAKQNTLSENSDLTTLLNNLKYNSPKIFKRVETVDLVEVAGVKPEKSASNKVPSVVENKQDIEVKKKQSVPLKTANSTKETVEAINEFRLDFNVKEELKISDLDAQQTVELFMADDFKQFVAQFEDSKWQSKIEAFNTVSSRLERYYNDNPGIENALYVYLMVHTNNFRISNVNILKAAVEFICSLVRISKTENKILLFSIIDIFYDKLADKKLQNNVEQLLDCISKNKGHAFILARFCSLLEKGKSPSVRQACVIWIKDVVETVAAKDLPFLVLVKFLMSELLDNKAASWRSNVIDAIARIYNLIGPRVTTIVNQFDINQHTRALLEAEFLKIGYDPNKSVTLDASSNINDIPRQDLCVLLDKNILNDLGNTEGKDSWQLRKQSIDSIIAACTSSGNRIENTKFVADVLKGLKARTVDTQSNLKPLAMCALSKLISSLDCEASVKYIKFYGSTILAGLGDNKKTMRDASILALETALTNDGNINYQGFLSICSNIPEVLSNLMGRFELLTWLTEHQNILRDCSDLISPIINCLLDKSSAVRATAESLLRYIFNNNFAPVAVFDRAIRDLSSANLRSIQAHLDRILIKNAEQCISAHNPVENIDNIPLNEPTKGEQIIKSKVNRTQGHLNALQKKISYDQIREQLHLDCTENMNSEQVAQLFGENWQSSGFRALSSIVDHTDWLDTSDLLFRWLLNTLSCNVDLSNTVMNYMHLLLSKPEVSFDNLELNIIVPTIFEVENLNVDSEVISRFVNSLCCHFSVSAVFDNFIVGLKSNTKSCVSNCLQSILFLVRTHGYTTLPRSSIRNLLSLALEYEGSGFIIECYKQLFTLLFDQYHGNTQDIQKMYGRDFDISSLLGSISRQNDIESNVIPAHLRLIKTIADIKLSLTQSELSPSLVEIFFSWCNVPLRDSNAPLSEIQEASWATITLLASVSDYCFRAPISKRNFYLSIAHCCVIALRKISLLGVNSIANNPKEAVFKLVDAMINFYSIDNCFDLLKSINLIILDILHSLKGIDLLFLLVDFTRFSTELYWKVAFNALQSISFESLALDGLELPTMRVLYTSMESILQESRKRNNSDCKLKLFKMIHSKVIKIVGSEIAANLVEGRSMFSLISNGCYSMQELCDSPTLDKATEIKLSALINEITFSRDKTASIRELIAIKRENPSINIELHLQKLSSTFRRFIMDELSKMEHHKAVDIDTNDNMELGKENQPMTEQATEALRIIETLKSRQFVALQGSDQNDFRQDRCNSSDTPSSSRKLSRNTPVASPFAKRNEKIRDSLNSLSQALDLPIILSDHGIEDC